MNPRPGLAPIRGVAVAMTAKEKLVHEIGLLLAAGNVRQALPLAERGSRQNPQNAELASFYILALCQSGKALEGLRYYHERVDSVNEPELLAQAASLAWMQLNLKHLIRHGMRSIASHNPAEFAKIEAECQREARLWGVSEEQLLFEDQACERYLLEDYDWVEEQASEWWERYPNSGKLRAVVAATRYQQGRLQEGLEACRFDQVCPGLLFQEVKLLLALGRSAQANRVARPLARHRSRDEEELVAQLMTLLLLNQNKTLIRVALRTRLDLEHPKIQLCLASAWFAQGQHSQAALHLRHGEKLLDPGELEFNQMVLESGDGDLGWLRAFAVLKLMPRQLVEQARYWVDRDPDGPIPAKTLRDVRRFLERRPHLLKLAPWLWTYADLPQRFVAALFLAAYPEDGWLRKRLRRFLKRHPGLPRTKQLLLQSGAAPSGVYCCDGEQLVTVSVTWDPSWSPDCSGKAREMLRSVGQFMAQKRYPEAETMILRALEFQPDSPDLLNQQATCLRFLEREEDAMARIERVLTLKPDHPGALLTRAGYLARHGQPAEARKLWRSVERKKVLWVGHMGEFFLSYYHILKQTHPHKADAWLAHWRELQPGHPLQTFLANPKR